MSAKVRASLQLLVFNVIFTFTKHSNRFKHLLTQRSYKNPSFSILLSLTLRWEKLSNFVVSNLEVRLGFISRQRIFFSFDEYLFILYVYIFHVAFMTVK